MEDALMKATAILRNVYDAYIADPDRGGDTAIAIDAALDYLKKCNEIMEETRK